MEEDGAGGEDDELGGEGVLEEGDFWVGGGGEGERFTWLKERWR